MQPLPADVKDFLIKRLAELVDSCVVSYVLNK
jgi:hypothetical protein